jgi:hypothetical protein
MQLVSPLGATWELAPHLSGLNAAEGGFTTTLGWFGVKWMVVANVWNAEVSTPVGTSGKVRVPNGVSGTVKVDGEVTKALGGWVSLKGGKHLVTVGK